MKPFLILLQYNGYNKSVIINHFDPKLALELAYKQNQGVLYCKIIR
jgi:hypothetical protein